jgi:hypothetical protein
MTKAKLVEINYKALLAKGWDFVVLVEYDCYLGAKGALVSRHRTYKAAEKSAKPHSGFVAIRDSRSYA